MTTASPCAPCDEGNRERNNILILGVVASVLAVVCKQCQGLQCIVGRIQPISLCKPCVMSVRGPNNVGRAVQTDSTLVRYALATKEQKKCWELLPEKFDRFQTLRKKTRNNNNKKNRCCTQLSPVVSRVQKLALLRQLLDSRSQGDKIQIPFHL